MRPLELTIEGLRSFRARVTLDLRGRDQIAIVGDTGAGKSSIIEAITYALFGQATFSGPNRELMNDAADHLRVVLRFRAGDGEWEVARSLRRRGSRTVAAEPPQLSRFGADGVLLEKVEQARPVNDRIEQVIGLNRDAFLRTTVLPQGRFAQLLVEDDPRVRATILRQVWRTDELEEAGRVAVAAHAAIVTLKARLDQAAAAHPEDPRAHLEYLQRQTERAQRAVVQAEKTERTASNAFQAVTAAVEQGKRAHEAAEPLGAFRAPELTAAVAPVAATAEQIDRQESELGSRQAALAAELKAIPTDDDGPSAAEVTGALTTLAGIPALAGDVSEAARQLAERRAAADQAQAAAAAAEAAARRVQERLTAEQARGRELEQMREHAEQQLERVAEGLGDARGALEAVQTAHDELTRCEQLLSETTELLRQAEAEGERLGLAEAHAREHHQAAQRSQSAAVVAGHLHPGDQCPICSALLAGDWQRPVSVDLDQAASAAGAAARAAGDARAAHAEHAAGQKMARRTAAAAAEQLRGHRDTAVLARAELKRRLAACLAAPAAAEFGEAAPGTEEAVALLDATLAVPVSPLPTAAVLLAPLEERLAAAQRASDEHAGILGELQEATARQEIEAQAKAQAAAGADASHAAAVQSAKAAGTRMRQAVASIPEPYRPEPDPVDERVAAARHRERVLAGRARGRTRLGDSLREIAQQTAALARRRTTEVEQPLGDTVRDLNRQRDLLARCAGALAREVDLPDALATADPQAATARIALLASLTGDLAHGAAELAERSAAARDTATATLAEIARGIESPAQGHETVVKHALTAAESARHTARTAHNDAAAFAAKVEMVEALRDLLGEAEKRERALSDLAAALKDGAFLKWLTLRRSRSLLVHASRTLEQISNGRYAFVEPADEFDRWQVLDRDSGQPRSPASLSGGEQFIASLALAMGMVEMMARSGGRLEALFLDEGFGSLDRSNLDAAIEALGQVAASGRMVVLISHVQAVAEQVPDVAAVTRTAAGSRVEWLTDAQRQRLGETDAGSSALSGLLD